MELGRNKTLRMKLYAVKYW